MSYSSAPLNVLASWVAYLQKHGLREEFIFKINEATQQANELKKAFQSGARYTSVTASVWMCCFV
jgi:hypothetical protein